MSFYRNHRHTRTTQCTQCMTISGTCTNCLLSKTSREFRESVQVCRCADQHIIHFVEINGIIYVHLTGGYVPVQSLNFYEEMYCRKAVADPMAFNERHLGMMFPVSYPDLVFTTFHHTNDSPMMITIK